MDLQSVFVYGGLLFISIFFSYIAQKKDDKRYLYIIIVLLSLVAGLRAITVGIDTATYTQHFSNLKIGRPDLVFGMETIFKYFCMYFLQIFKDEHFLFIFFALLTHGFVIIRFWDFREHASLPWAIACYYIMFYTVSLNAMRQLIAIAILFYGTRYITSKKYLKFLLFLFLATLFHNSALIGILFLCVAFFFEWKTLDKKKKKMFLLAMLCLIVIGGIIALILITKGNIIERYKKYFTNIKIDIGFMQLAKLMFLIGSGILLCYEKKSSSTQKMDVIQRKLLSAQSYKRKLLSAQLYQQKLLSVQLYYGLGILLTSLGYIFENAHRIGWYFGIVEGVYFGILVKDKKFRYLFQIAIFVLLAYYFMTDLKYGGNGELPYRFFWQ